MPKREADRIELCAANAFICVHDDTNHGETWATSLKAVAAAMGRNSQPGLMEFRHRLRHLHPTAQKLEVQTWEDAPNTVSITVTLIPGEEYVLTYNGPYLVEWA